MPSSESSILHAVIDTLLWNKCYVLRVNSGTIQNASTGSWVSLAPKGHSDLLCSLKIDGYNVLAFIECKASGGRLTDAQIAFLRLREKEHFPWLVCSDPKQIEQFIAEPFTYHGDPKNVALVLDESRKFIPTYDGRRHRKTEKMSWEVMAQIDRWKK